jgi:4'-phosphopantetheinyl transferase
MGRLAGAAGDEPDPTVTALGTRWLRLGEVPADLARPAIWLAADDDPAWAVLVARVKPSAVDLADAALFSSAARAAGRLARRLLLKALVAAALDVSVEAVVIERSAAGAIAVIAPDPLCVSLSARDGWTMAGLSRLAIGVDIETGEPAAPLPVDLLHPREAEAVAALGEDRRGEAFARHWAVKEAVLKALAGGFNLDPTRFEARFEGDGAQVFRDGGDQPAALAEVRRRGPGVAAVAALA